MRIRGLLGNGVSELCEGLLRNDTGIGEPFSIWLDAGIGKFTGLKSGGLRDLSLCVTLGSASFQDVEDLDLFGVAVEILALERRLAWAVHVCCTRR